MKLNKKMKLIKCLNAQCLTEYIGIVDNAVKPIDKEVTRFEKESLKILHQLYGEETKTIENVNHVCKVFYIRSAFYIMMRGFITNRLESDIHDIVSDLIDICNVSDFSEPKEKSQK